MNNKGFAHQCRGRVYYVHCKIQFSYCKLYIVLYYTVQCTLYVVITHTYTPCTLNITCKLYKLCFPEEGLVCTAPLNIQYQTYNTIPRLVFGISSLINRSFKADVSNQFTRPRVPINPNTYDFLFNLRPNIGNILCQ